MQFKLVGRDISDTGKYTVYLVKNMSNGEVLPATSKWIADSILRGDEFDRVELGHQVAPNEYSIGQNGINLKYLPLYEKVHGKGYINVHEGLVEAFGLNWCTKTLKYTVLCINQALDIVELPLDGIGRSGKLLLNNAVQKNSSRRSTTTTDRDSWITKNLWRYQDGKFIGWSELRPIGDLLLLNIIKDKKDDDVGYKVMTPDMRVVNIPAVEMNRHFFINAEICDLPHGHKKVYTRGFNTHWIFELVDKTLSFENINSQPVLQGPCEQYELTGPNCDLKKCYDWYNYKYFGGRLPSKIQIQWSDRLSRAAGNCSEYDRIINISRSYCQKYPDDARNVLGHEMIHLEIHNHGRDFQSEIARLQSAGLNAKMHSLGRSKDKNKYYYVRCDRCYRVFARKRLVPDGGMCSHCHCNIFQYKFVSDDRESDWMYKEDIKRYRENGE